MSTFLGPIEEFPGISVDRFDGENLKSSAYFLSHCHTDHMVGLNEYFLTNLERFNKYLYCSPISKAFLEGKYNLEKIDRVKELKLCNSEIIDYIDHNNKVHSVTVTCISAGHCPGSIMFHFENNNTSVLYTGDFRIHPDDYPKLKPLHCAVDSQKVPKKFDKIYLDTTFLNLNFPYLPSRKDSLLEICKAAKDWLEKDPRNVVILECSALYGSEFLYMELSNYLKKKVHVKNFVYNSYCRIPELACHITNEPHSTPIHACMGKMQRSGLYCRHDVEHTNILTIVPSAMRWAGRDLSKIVELDENRERTVYVCYSTHPSFEEVKAFIEYFEAKEIFPSVCPEDSAREIYSLLREIKGKAKCYTKFEEVKTLTLTLPERKDSRVTFKSEFFSSDEDDLVL